MTTSKTTPFPTAAVGDIRVGDHHRKDLGNLVDLTKSIRDVGLLHPLVVTPELQLVAGRRRLEAVRELGWTTVPVRVVDGLDDALAALRAERDENTCRKDFTVSEAVAIGQALEELERTEAKKRQREGGRSGGKASGNLPEASKGDTRDKVAAAVGMSGRTYDKAKYVVEAAEKEPEKHGDLVQEMNQTGKVDPAHKKLQQRGGTRANKKRSRRAPSELPGAVATLKRLMSGGQVTHDDAIVVARLDKPEQRTVVREGAAAVKAKAADLRWLRGLPWFGGFGPGSSDPGAEVSEGARRQALEKLKKAMEGLRQSCDTIAGWIDTLEKKLRADDAGK
jgi:ParB family chromosome partitioning protein